MESKSVSGDGLVPLASALGERREALHALKVPPHRTRIVTSAGHWELLSREEVYAQLRAWLAENPCARPSYAAIDAGCTSAAHNDATWR